MHILITGAAQGIGAAIARALAQSSNTLYLADLQLGPLTVLAEELAPRVTKVQILVGNLTDVNFRKGIMAQITQLDVLINNAGVTHLPKPITEISEDEFDFNFNVNTKVPFFLMQQFLPLIKQSQTGWIFNMSSSANIDGYEELSVYAATKAALSSLTDSVAKELQDFPNVKAIALMPSRTNTPMQVAVRGEAVAQASQPPEFIGRVIKEIIDGVIPVKSGDDVRIHDGRYLVEERITQTDF